MEVADLVAWLPAGCAFWRDVGGPNAWSREERVLHDVEFQLRYLMYLQPNTSGTKPKPTPPPPFAHERRAAEAKQSRKAEAFLRRQNRS
jgi:hypothetical protein